MKDYVRRLVCIVASIGVTATSFGADRQKAGWVGSWAAAPLIFPLKDTPGNSTFRNIVHLNLGGPNLRITLTNQFGTTPLSVADVHVATSTGKDRINIGSDHPVTFNQSQSVTIPPGSYVISDPVPMPVAANSDLAISFYVPEQAVATPTCHQLAESTNYVVAGNSAEKEELANARTQTSWCFIQAVDVLTPEKDAAAVVALGDSITDGARSAMDANHRYPDYLAARLRANRKTRHLSVLNEGISGGRVLYEGHGPSVMQRLDRDVFASSGVRYLIYLEGINDIGQILKSISAEKDLKVDDLILGATQLVTRAHQHDVKVIGATLLPFGPKDVPPGSNWLRARQVLDQYNDWVRTSHVFDGVVDFNKAVADPQAPQTILPAYDSGDHVHPSDAGYEAMARAVDLGLLSH